MVIVGVVMVGLGLRLYLTADIIAIPPDALAVAFAWRTKKPLHLCKRVFDCCMVLLSAGLSLAFFRDISGLWIGTVIAALGVGYALKFFSRLLEQPLERWLYGEPAAQADIDRVLHESQRFSDVEKEFAHVQEVTHCSTGCGGCHDKILEIISQSISG